MCPMRWTIIDRDLSAFGNFVPITEQIFKARKDAKKKDFSLGILATLR